MFDFPVEKLVLGDFSGGSCRIDSPQYDRALASFGYIKSDLDDIGSSFIRLGFHLHEFMSDKENHYSLGYDNFYDAIENNFGLSRSSVSCLIDVWKRFSKEQGYVHTMFIDDKYSDYSYSQLVEMLPLSNKEIVHIKPEMTVKQIRAYKKQLKSAEKLRCAEHGGLLCDVAQDKTAEDVPANGSAPDKKEFATSQTIDVFYKQVCCEIKRLKDIIVAADDVEDEYFSGYVDALDDIKKFAVHLTKQE